MLECCTVFIEYNLVCFAFSIPFKLVMLLQVSAKRTNIPGMKQFRPRRSNPYMGFRGRAPFMGPFMYPPYGYG